MDARRAERAPDRSAFQNTRPDERARELRSRYRFTAPSEGKRMIRYLISEAPWKYREWRTAVAPGGSLSIGERMRESGTAFLNPDSNFLAALSNG
jgi:hypothetical protein